MVSQWPTLRHVQHRSLYLLIKKWGHPRSVMLGARGRALVSFGSFRFAIDTIGAVYSA